MYSIMGVLNPEAGCYRTASDRMKINLSTFTTRLVNAFAYLFGKYIFGYEASSTPGCFFVKKNLWNQKPMEFLFEQKNLWNFFENLWNFCIYFFYIFFAFLS